MMALIKAKMERLMKNRVRFGTNKKVLSVSRMLKTFMLQGGECGRLQR